MWVPIMFPPAPLPSLEVRWYFEGPAQAHSDLCNWFNEVHPRSGGKPKWTPRQGDQPDVYLLLPDRDDMGIKWREGELQIKGRVSTIGLLAFEGRHQGVVERWIKWSFADIPAAYRELFAEKADGLRRVSVKKIRALRKIQLRPGTAAPAEVEPSARIDRGIGIELSELTVNGKSHCSLAFEAFPDDSGVDSEFSPVVSSFIASLSAPRLSANNSLSFPTWLNQLAT
jgi:hypothetical protein